MQGQLKCTSVYKPKCSNTGAGKYSWSPGTQGLSQYTGEICDGLVYAQVQCCLSVFPWKEVEESYLKASEIQLRSAKSTQVVLVN